MSPHARPLSFPPCAQPFYLVSLKDVCSHWVGILRELLSEKHKLSINLLICDTLWFLNDISTCQLIRTEPTSFSRVGPLLSHSSDFFLPYLNWLDIMTTSKEWVVTTQPILLLPLFSPFFRFSNYFPRYTKEKKLFLISYPEMSAGLIFLIRWWTYYIWICDTFPLY